MECKHNIYKLLQFWILRIFSRDYETCPKIAKRKRFIRETLNWYSKRAIIHFWRFSSALKIRCKNYLTQFAQCNESVYGQHLPRFWKLVSRHAIKFKARLIDPLPVRIRNRTRGRSTRGALFRRAARNRIAGQIMRRAFSDLNLLMPFRINTGSLVPVKLINSRRGIKLQLISPPMGRLNDGGIWRRRLFYRALLLIRDEWTGITLRICDFQRIARQLGPSERWTNKNDETKPKLIVPRDSQQDHINKREVKRVHQYRRQQNGVQKSKKYERNPNHKRRK